MGRELVEDLERRVLLAGDIQFDDPIQVEVGNGRFRSVVTEDFDGDGDQDLVVLNSTDDNFSVLLNDGQGVFAQRRYSTGVRPLFGIATDLNGDGVWDLALRTRADDYRR